MHISKGKEQVKYVKGGYVGSISISGGLQLKEKDKPKKEKK